MSDTAEQLLFPDLNLPDLKVTSTGIASAVNFAEGGSVAGVKAVVPSSVMPSSVVPISVVPPALIADQSADVTPGRHRHGGPRLATPRHAVVRRIKNSTNGGSWEVSDAGFAVGTYLGFESRNGQVGSSAPENANAPLSKCGSGRTHPMEMGARRVSRSDAVGSRAPSVTSATPLVVRPVVAPSQGASMGTASSLGLCQEQIQAWAGYVFAAALLACTFFV